MATPLAQTAPLPAVLPRHDGRNHARVRTALRWIGLSLAGCLLLATWRHAQIGQAFTVDARARHAVLAQRMDQHDAHLTSLAAVAQLDDPEYTSFKAVAAAVRKYYPRVVDIDLVRLGTTPRVLATTDGGAEMPVSPEALRTLAQSLSPGKAGVLAAGDGGRYALVKRLGTDTVSALVLSIDVARLVAMDGDDER